MDGFSQETLKNRWSLNARNKKLTSFVFCVEALDSWNFSRGSRLFLSQFFDPFTVANSLQFIGKDLVAWRVQPSHARVLPCC